VGCSVKYTAFHEDIIDYSQELHCSHELLKFTNEMRSSLKFPSGCCFCPSMEGPFLVREESFGGLQEGRGGDDG
jgi:hypothetical protein